MTGCSPLDAARVAEHAGHGPAGGARGHLGPDVPVPAGDGTVVLGDVRGGLPARGGAGGPAQVAAAASVTGAGPRQPVGDVGDAAFFYVTAQGAHVLALATDPGETVTSVTLTASGPRRAPRERLVDLGHLVLRALDGARGR